MHWTIRRKILIGFGLSWLAMVIVGTVAYLTTVNLISYVNQTQHAQIVQDNIDDLLTNLVDAETGQRGFIITGADEFLEPYNSALPRIEERLQMLRGQAASDDPHSLTQQAQLDTLEGLIAQHLELLATTIQIRQTQGYDAVQATITAGENKAIMDEIRTLLAEMEEDETEYLNQSGIQLQANVQFAVVIIGLGTLLTLGTAVVGGISLASRIDKSTNALVVGVREIAAGNLDYKFPVSSHDEIAELTAAFNQMAGRLQIAQTELTQSNTLFQSLFESSPEAILVVNRQGKIELANAQVEKVFGYPPVELLGMAIENLLPERYRVQHEQHRAHYMEHPFTRLMGSGLELYGRHRSGTEFPVDVVLSALPKPEANLVLSAVRDITERERAEAELHIRVEQVHDLYNNAPCGYHSLDQGGVFVAINDTELKWLGYEREDVIGKKNIADFLTPSSLETFQQNFPLFKERGGIRDVELDLICANGSILPVLVSATAVKDAEGNFIMSRSTLFDITELKKARETLQKVNEELEQRVQERTAELARSEKEFRTLAEHSLVGIFRTTVDGKILYINEALTKMLGFASITELMEENILAHYKNTEDRAALIDILKQTGSKKNHEVELLTKNGEPRIVLESVSLEGEILSGMLIDVTDRKQAEESLRKSQEQLLSLVNDAPVSIAMFDREMHYIASSRRWTVEYGRGYENLTGLSHYSVHPDLPEYWKEAHRKGLAGEPSHNDNDLWIQEDGTKNWLRWAIVPWHDTDGEIGGIIISAEDITVPKLAEQALRESEERFRSLFENMINGFAYCRMLYENGQPDDFIYLDVNDAFEKLTGLKDVSGKRVTEVIPGIRESNPELFEIYGRVALTGKAEKFETYVPFLGQGIWFSVSVYSPQREHFVAVFETITERKQAEEALRLSESRYRALFEDVPVAIWEEDFSQVKKYLDSLKEQGITDFHTYFATHPEEVEKCSNMIRLLDVNNTALQIYGAGSKDELLKSTAQTLSKGEKDHNHEDFIAIAEGKTSNLWEGADETMSGEPIEISLHWSVAPNHEEDFSKVIVTTTDITERKRAERSMQIKDELLRMTGEMAKVGGWEFDTDTMKGTWTDEVARIHDLDPEQETNVSLGLNFYSGESRGKIENAVKDVVALAKPYDLELEMISAKGNHKWIRTIALPIVEGDKVVKVRGIFQDITERKKAEEEIHRLNTELEQRVKIRTAQLAQTNLDLQAEIAEREQLEVQLRQNEARAQTLADVSRTLAEARLDHQPLFEMIARRVSELLGDSCNLSLISRDGKWLGTIALYHPDKEGLAFMKSIVDTSPYPVGQGLAGQVAKTGEPVLIPIVPLEQILQQIKPEFLPYVDRYGIASVLIVPMRARDRVIGTLGVSRDQPGRPYTPEDQTFLQDLADRAGLAVENTRLFMEAMEAREDADEANLAKSEFLSRMSHELRTPLNAILGFAQILGMDEMSNRQKGSINHILRAGKHLLGLINEVLDITRIEVGKLSLSPEAVRVKDVVEETIELVEVQASRRNIQVETSSLFSGYVKADRQRLKQVLLNLLTNAIKYNREEGKVFVDCVTVPGERLQIRVRDTGPGISPDRQNRLFIPFERLGAEQTNVEGTGLGLSLSRRLVEAMGGTLNVESKPGTGSTFWIALSIVESPMEQTYHPEDGIILFKPGSDYIQTHTVLCFEDNLSSMQLIEQIFKHRPSVNLMASTDGKTGLKVAHEKTPDLILLDLNLPDITGYQVLHQLKADPQTRKIPVIIISADATPGQIQRLLDAGAQTYLIKPLDVGQFLQAVDEILEES
ncbi:MAG TPA: PAS domain S-box protein, partial [Anaerolineales bacterium]|nr:PAS domain S-box protein [Anaerolineales bacterium]